MILMKTNDIETLIERFLANDISGEDLVTLLDWASGSERNMAVLSSRMKAWACKDNSFDADAAFARFRDRVSQEKSQNVRPHRISWRGIAASVAAAVAAGVIVYQSFQVRDFRNMYADSSVMVEAPDGSKTRIVLPDSSTVWLNAGSSLRYSFDPEEKERKVSLRGEGFFEVRHDESKPFIVSSSNLDVRVLGTKFNYCDYPEDSIAEVSLTEGRIALSDRTGKELVMSPDESAVFNKMSGTMTVGKSTYKADEWITGNLTFDEVPLLEIVRRLERTYSVRIRIDDAALCGLRFYGSFNSSVQDIQEVLRSLSATGKFRFRTERDAVILYR